MDVIEKIQTSILSLYAIFRKENLGKCEIDELPCGDKRMPMSGARGHIKSSRIEKEVAACMKTRCKHRLETFSKLLLSHL